MNDWTRDKEDLISELSALRAENVELKSRAISFGKAFDAEEESIIDIGCKYGLERAASVAAVRIASIAGDLNAMRDVVVSLRNENASCVTVVGEFGKEVGKLKVLLSEAREMLNPIHSRYEVYGEPGACEMYGCRACDLKRKVDAALGEKEKP
jgi:hypothetical protein